MTYSTPWRVAGYRRSGASVGAGQRPLDVFAERELDPGQGAVERDRLARCFAPAQLDDERLAADRIELPCRMLADVVPPASSR